MGLVTVETVHLSPSGVRLVILDHTRQQAYAKMQAEQFKLDKLLIQVAQQSSELKAAKLAYDKSVAEMDAVSRRNQSEFYKL